MSFVPRFRAWTAVSTTLKPVTWSSGGRRKSPTHAQELATSAAPALTGPESPTADSQTRGCPGATFRRGQSARGDGTGPHARGLAAAGALGQRRALRQVCGCAACGGRPSSPHALSSAQSVRPWLGKDGPSRGGPAALRSSPAATRGSQLLFLDLCVCFHCFYIRVKIRPLRCV